MREVLFKGLILTLGISCVFPVLYVLWVRQQLIKKASTKVSLFFALWILPPLSFNLFFRTDHAGYQLSYLIPLMILSSLAIKNLFKSKKIVLVLVLIVVLCNLFLFFRNRDPENTREYIPTSFHYSEIRKNDIKLGTKIEFIKTFDPNSSAIIVGEPDYIRPIMYYLPEFRIVQIDVLATKDPNFKDILREAKNFSMNTWKNNTNTYSFAKPVDTLICFDDECDKWVKGEKKIFLFPANSRIAVSKGPFLKIHYKLNSLSYSSL